MFRLGPAEYSRHRKTGAGFPYACFSISGFRLLLQKLFHDSADNRRVALAVILTEVDAYGNEYPRGTKAFTIPAHHYPHCRDILVKCIRFVLPEDLNVSGGTAGSICGPRNLKARFIAHNIDTDYRCCDVFLTV